eukprot:c18420_g1_i1.p1 GENE.c18420_g1_i1~~c18420_g1_i1.p1  ORF type:complete len:682 (+),score=226.35 c18420_g1_i1:59-2104(+)
MEEIVGMLQNKDKNVQLSSIRTIKNQIIGSPNKKAQYVRANLIPEVLKAISLSKDDEFKIQAAHVLGSISFGDTDTTVCISESDIVKIIMDEIILSNNNHNLLVLSAFLKCLKNIIVCVSKTQIEEICQHKNLQMFAFLLQKSEEIQIKEYITRIITKCCNDSERHKQISSTTIPESIVNSLLSNSSFSSNNISFQESLLECLSMLTIYNSNGEFNDFSQIMKQEKMVQTLLLFASNSKPEFRLYSCKCFANLNHQKNLEEYSYQLKQIILPTLLRLLDDPSKHIAEEAPHILDKLIRNDENLQTSAFNVGIITKLTNVIIEEKTLSNKQTQGAIHAIAAIASLSTNNRMNAFNTTVLSMLSSKLNSNDEGVRAAVCDCIRSFSRSVKTLRTLLIENGFVPLLILRLSDDNIDVQKYACGAICNLALEFSSVKDLLSDKSAITKLVTFTKSSNIKLRLYSVWTFANLCFMADDKIKDCVLEALPASQILEMAETEKDLIKEKVLYLIRNILFGGNIDHIRLLVSTTILQKNSSDDMFMSDENNKENEEMETENNQSEITLFSILEKSLNCLTNDSFTIIQALYIVCNLTTGGHEILETILKNTTLLNLILQNMSSEDPNIQIATIWCTNSLIQRDIQNWQKRCEKLSQIGFEKKLFSLKNESETEIKMLVDKVMTALHNEQ